VKVDLTGKAGEIFLKAVELEGAARVAYLEGACDGDAALHDQVTHLLAHHHEEDLVAGAPHVEALPPVARESGEWTETGAFVSRLLGTPRSRTVFLLGVVGLVTALGLWARHAILAELDRQLHSDLSRRLELEVAHVEEWVRGRLVDVESTSRDPELVHLAGILAKRGTDLNASLEARHEQLTTDDLQARVHAAIEHVLRRDDLEGYALIHRSGVLLAAMNHRFVGEQLTLNELQRGTAHFSLPTNPEEWGAARSHLVAEVADLEAMSWVEAPVLWGEPKADGREPVLVSLVIGSPAREFSRILRTGDGGPGGTSETYAVDRAGHLRSDNRFGRSYVESLRARGIEPVWRDDLSVDVRDQSRLASFALIDPGNLIEQLPADSVLPGTRPTKILDDVTEHLRLGERAPASACNPIATTVGSW
jgi:hypothetical protein